jgi:5-methylcytosine-specific restriction enzyme A
MPKSDRQRESNREHDARRQTAQPWRKWYRTARWRAIRAAQLRSRPLCWQCEERGETKEATVCNHAERHNGDPVKFWSGPFNSMCKDCHDVDQQRIEHGGKARQAVGVDGWPLEGGGVGGRHN